MKLTIQQYAEVLRPFHTETGRRLCVELLNHNRILPEDIDSDGFICNLAEPRGKTMMKSLDAVIQLQEWGHVVLIKKLEDLAFDEAKPNSLEHDLKRLERAYKRRIEKNYG